MASRFYGVNVGAMLPKDVTESSSTTSSAVELQIDLAKVTTRLAILQCIEALESYMETVEGDPAS